LPIPAGIKNIIFDLGGVLLNLDYHRTINAFKELGLTSFEQVYSQAAQKKLFDEYEMGLISSDHFRSGLNRLLGKEISPETIDAAWNAMLLDLPTERLELLKKLKSRYRLFLLSNTNDIHYNAWSAYLQSTYGFPDFRDFFEKEYYSHLVGRRKPAREIFEMVLSENGLERTETLFIDDSIQHVEGARLAGLHAHHLQPSTTILHLFNEDLI
jgi:glucose-1-phosphatase